MKEEHYGKPNQKPTGRWGQIVFQDWQLSADGLLARQFDNLTRRLEFEQRIRETSEHPPEPGENGFWMIWDADAGRYVESDALVPVEGAENYGSYYTPSVNAEGVLTFVPSRKNMPAVPAANVIGPAGPTGEKGEAGAADPQGEQGPKGDAGKPYVPSYWQAAVNAAVEKIKALQAAGGAQMVSFTYHSDMHINGRNTDYCDWIGHLIAAVLDECKIPFSVDCGDTVQSGSAASKDYILVDLAEAEAVMSTRIPSPPMTCLFRLLRSPARPTSPMIRRMRVPARWTVTPRLRLTLCPSTRRRRKSILPAWGLAPTVYAAIRVLQL